MQQLIFTNLLGAVFLCWSPKEESLLPPRRGRSAGAAPSFQAVVESDKVSPSLLFSRLNSPPQLHQLFLIRFVLQTLLHRRCPSLNMKICTIILHLGSFNQPPPSPLWPSRRSRGAGGGAAVPAARGRGRAQAAFRARRSQLRARRERPRWGSWSLLMVLGARFAAAQETRQLLVGLHDLKRSLPAKIIRWFCITESWSGCSKGCITGTCDSEDGFGEKNWALGNQLWLVKRSPIFCLPRVV